MTMKEGLKEAIKALIVIVVIMILFFYLHIPMNEGAGV